MRRPEASFPRVANLPAGSSVCVDPGWDLLMETPETPAVVNGFVRGGTPVSLEDPLPQKTGNHANPRHDSGVPVYVCLVIHDRIRVVVLHVSFHLEGERQPMGG